MDLTHEKIEFVSGFVMDRYLDFFFMNKINMVVGIVF
jgi:hypothetical protein